MSNSGSVRKEGTNGWMTGQNGVDRLNVQYAVHWSALAPHNDSPGPVCVNIVSICAVYKRDVPVKGHAIGPAVHLDLCRVVLPLVLSPAHSNRIRSIGCLSIALSEPYFYECFTLVLCNESFVLGTFVERFAVAVTTLVPPLASWTGYG